MLQGHPYHDRMKGCRHVCCRGLTDEFTTKIERGRLDRDLIDTLAGGLIRLFARLERVVA